MLIPPAPGDRRTSWRARFKDPDSGRFSRVRLDLHEYPSAEARREWAIRKSRTLIGRRLDLDAGAPRFTGTPLSEAIERFFAEKQAELRPASVGLYRTVGNKLLAWASDKGLHKADDLTRAKLVDFRVKLISEKKRLHLEGSKRNELVETDEPRSPHTINSDLRKAGTILTRLVELDLLPRLRREDYLRDALATELDRCEATAPAGLAVVEGYAFNARANREALGEWGGLVRVLLYERGWTLLLVPPATLKSWCTGSGRGSKGMVAMHVLKRFDYEASDDNDADAHALMRLGLEWSAATDGTSATKRAAEVFKKLLPMAPARVGAPSQSMEARNAVRLA